MKTYLGLILGMLVLMTSCAGTDADLEQAKYLVGRGSVSDGQEAESLVTPYLTSGDLKTKMEAYRILGGAYVAQAGFSPARIISNLVYQDGNNTVNALAGALQNITDGPAARALLEKAFTRFDEITSDADFTAIDSSSPLYRDKEGIYYGYGISELLYSLVIGVVESGLLGTTSFTATICQQNLQSTTLPQDFVSYVRKSRVNFISAGLDDVEQKQELGLTADSSNNQLNKFIEDIQDQVDSNHNGVVGSAADEANNSFDSLGQLCDYLKTQK